LRYAGRVARLFLVKFTKMGKNTTNNQMARKYTKIFHSKALQNVLKLGFSVWKYTFWQPCFLVTL
jgi:hypothetical protein